MGFLSDLKASFHEVNQNTLLNRAQSAYIPYAEMVQIARKMDREHMSILYEKIWYKSSDGLKAIVESGNYYYETTESLMLRTDVPKEVSKKVIEHYVFYNCEKIVLHRYLDETDTDLLKLLEWCLQVNGVKFPLDKSSEIVQTCLDDYVDRFIIKNNWLVIDSLTRPSSLISYSILPIEFRNRNNSRRATESEKNDFKRRYGYLVKQYGMKEISYTELRDKLTRYH